MKSKMTDHQWNLCIALFVASGFFMALGFRDEPWSTFGIIFGGVSFIGASALLLPDHLHWWKH